MVSGGLIAMWAFYGIMAILPTIIVFMSGRNGK